MSAIIDKPFNVAQRIVRTLFRGTPNLFTTSDINRQIEAFKYQIDRIECQSYSGIAENLTINAVRGGGGSGSTITATISPVSSGKMYVTARGCKFDLGQAEISVERTMTNGQYACVVLRGTSQLVTYSGDPTHLISGALFADGTSKPAADHLVFTSAEIVFVGADEINLDTDVAILAVVKAIPITSSPLGVYVLKNYTDSNLGFLAHRELLRIEDFDKTRIGAIQSGMRYDEAISILTRNLVHIGTAFPYFKPVNEEVLPYGWIPCGALRTYVGSYVQGELEDAYEAIYGAGNIIFTPSTVAPGGGSSVKYVRISQCLGLTIPDTTGRFLRAGVTENDLFQTGGSDTKTLSSENIPEHTHTAGTLKVTFPTGIMAWESDSGASELQSQNSHNSGWTKPASQNITGTTGSSGNSTPFDIRPSFVNSNYIMRVA